MVVQAAVAATKIAAQGVLAYKHHKSKRLYKDIYKAKKNLLSERRQTMESTAAYNEKQIMEAFQENYKNTSFAYGEKIRNVVSQASDAKNKIETEAVASISNVDLQGSSFMQSQLNKLDTEFKDATATLHRNQTSAIMALAKQKENQYLENKMSVIEAEKGLGMEEWQIQNDRDQSIKYQTAQMLRSGSKALEAGVEFAGSMKGISSAKQAGTFKNDFSFGNLYNALNSGGM